MVSTRNPAPAWSNAGERRGDDCAGSAPAASAVRHDSIAAPQAQRRMAERIPGAGYREFEGGHLFFVQDARAAEVIIAALAPAPDQQNVMPPAQPGAVSPADGADDTATRRT